MNKAVRRSFVIVFSCLFLLGTAFNFAYAQSNLDITVNYAQAEAIAGEYAYDVSVYFSLLDSAGIPVKDLSIDDVTISEDGKQVALTSLDSVDQQPIYITLVLDTSGSMGGEKIAAARDAAKAFIGGLNSEDMLAIITFNTDLTQQLDFTTDHKAAADQIDLIDTIPNSGTCLYDALNQALEKTSALPIGRRAVIVLTDGKDVLPDGSACSSLTLDDVIDLASAENSRVPIYSIGLGNSIDENGLERMATLTGGRYIPTSNAQQLSASFSRLLDQLQSEYVAHYKSTAVPGLHNINLQAGYLGASAQDSRPINMPAFPFSISFVSPTEGQEIDGNVQIVTSVTGQSSEIKQVIFHANDQVIGTDTSAPYEIDWRPDSTFVGTVTLTATAIGTDGNELAKSEVSILVTNTSLLPGNGSPSFNSLLKNKPLFFGGIILLIAVITVVILLVLRARKQKTEGSKDARWQDAVAGPPPPPMKMNDMTMDGFALSPNALGALTVMQSDDPSMLGQRFEISDDVTHLGRAADNEILFPKDGAVSRHHAIIENRNGQLLLTEMVSVDGDGSTKTPTFGTYVNEKKVTDPTPLMNGDTIRLGKRLTLRFEKAQQNLDDDAKTMDGFEIPDPEKTMG